MFLIHLVGYLLMLDSDSQFEAVNDSNNLHAFYREIMDSLFKDRYLDIGLYQAFNNVKFKKEKV